MLRTKSLNGNKLGNSFRRSELEILTVANNDFSFNLHTVLPLFSGLASAQLVTILEHSK
jgi:hypothetical protein